MEQMKERVENAKRIQGIRTVEELLARVKLYQPSMAKSTLLEIINPSARVPRIDNVIAIARALDTTVAYLIGETSDPLRPMQSSGLTRIGDQAVVYHIDTGGQEQRLLAVWRTLSPEDRERVYDLADRISQLTPRIVGAETQE
jgi:transcriptional regulator with XRE-family HTH domain